MLFFCNPGEMFIEFFLKTSLFSELLVVFVNNFMLSLSDKDNSPILILESFNENILSLNFLINDPTDN